MTRNGQDAHRRTIFKNNLRQKMEEKGLTKERLAEEMLLDRDGRKWLTRVCRDGLARPSPSTEKLLNRLAQQLGMIRGQELWSEDQREHWYLSELRLVLADMSAEQEDITGELKELDEEIERSIDRWRRQAADLRKLFADNRKRDALNKLRRTSAWQRTCQILAERNGTPDEAEKISQRFYDRAMKDGIDWARGHIEKTLASQPDLPIEE